MLVRTLSALAAAVVAVWPAGAQTFSNASLSGKYYFVQLLVTATGGQPSDVRNAGGAITFNGAGDYTWTGQTGAGTGALGASSGSGTYTVAADGSVSLVNPLRPSLRLNARLSGDRSALVGATTEAAENTNDIFIAVQAPASGVRPPVSGAYTAASAAFPNGTAAAMNSCVARLAADGQGQFTSVSVTGHAADQGGRNVTQSVTGATYTIGTDGTGQASFGAGSGLLTGGRSLFVSQDGTYLLGISTAAGVRDIFVASRGLSGTASSASLAETYSIAELTIDGASFSSAIGTVKVRPNGRVLISERVHLDTRKIDFAGVNLFNVNGDGSGALSPDMPQGLVNMGLGGIPSGGATIAGSLVGSQVGVVNTNTSQYGMFLAVRSPEFSSAGVFLHPAGVVNGASFAPSPHPIAPGAIVSLFGAGVTTTRVEATAVPMPATLGDVSVTINGTPAPIFAIDPTYQQINIQVPFEAAGDTVRVQFKKGATLSNEVSVPLAATSPAIFSWYQDANSPNRGLVFHGARQGDLVTPQDPARPGDYVVIWGTGLGALNPAVPTNTRNPDGTPGNPLAHATDAQILVYFGGVPAASMDFVGGAPGWVGLNQINAKIPASAPPGTNVPLAISSGNAYVDITDIAIVPLSVTLPAAEIVAGPVRVAASEASPLPPRMRR